MLKWTSSQAGPGQFSETEGVFRDINGMLATGGRLVLGLPGVYSDDTKQNLELLLLNSGFRDYRIEQVTSPQDSSFHELVALAVKTGLQSPTPVGGRRAAWRAKRKRNQGPKVQHQCSGSEKTVMSGAS